MASYGKLLRIDTLLSLQDGLGPDSEASNDEVLFLTVHQMFELCFKLVIREVALARNILTGRVANQELASTVRALRRAIVVFEQASHQFSLIETLTTRDYLVFRDRLGSGSGFQSAQMREIEVLLGLEERTRAAEGRAWREALRDPSGVMSEAEQRLEKRLTEGLSFRNALYDWLSQLPIDGGRDQASVDQFVERYLAKYRAAAEGYLAAALAQSPTESRAAHLREHHEQELKIAEAFLMATDDPAATEETRAYLRRVRAAIIFLESYRELPRLTWARELIDSVMELEQAILIWRGRHVRMVERMIGRRTGTGGSSGADYLEQTLKYRVFGDLWTARTLLLQPSSLPALKFADEYGFRRSRWSAMPMATGAASQVDIAAPAAIPSDFDPEPLSLGEPFAGTPKRSE
jgi:tryptophan 2,3-dioxygenase